MKTLVIHPRDSTTDFLSDMYSDKDWTLINTEVSNSQLRSAIKSHDRIIMLGHGYENGLIGYERLVIDSTFVQLLRTKSLVGIWCHADLFFNKYKLSGLYTGMIISEIEEAYHYSVACTYELISLSNKLLAESLSKTIDDFSIEEFLDLYKNIYNDVVNFNRLNFNYTL